MARKLQLFGKFPSGGGVDPSEIGQAVDNYLTENPPTPQITINGEGSDENGNFNVNSIVDITITDVDDDPGDTPGGNPEEDDFVVVNGLNNSNDVAVTF